MKYNKDEVLAGAREYGQQFLDAITFDGQSDKDKILDVLSRRTHNGKPVLHLVVDSPKEAVAALVLGAMIAGGGGGTGDRQETDQLRDQLGDLLWDLLWDQLQDQLGDQLQDQLGDSHRCIWDYYLMAFYESATAQIKNGVEFTATPLLDACRHGLGFLVNMGSICVAITTPEAHRDAEGRIHRETGPAIKWSDEEQSYWWHGTEIPAEWIENRDSIDPSLALTWENIEQRRCLAEILGWANVLEQLNPTVINTDDDPEIGQLLEVDLPDSGRERFLRVRCGTGRTFALPVPPDMTTALEANAWTYNIDPQIIKNLEVRT